MQTTQVDYRNGPLFPMILRFSIPAAISLLITAVYNIVDRVFVGNWVGTSALTGLSVCFPFVLHDDGLRAHVQCRRGHLLQPLFRPGGHKADEPGLRQRLCAGLLF